MNDPDFRQQQEVEEYYEAITSAIRELYLGKASDEDLSILCNAMAVRKEDVLNVS